MILVCPSLTYGQAISERAVITGSTSSGAATTKGIGRSIGAVFNKSARSIEPASGAAAASKPERPTGTLPRKARVPAAQLSSSGRPDSAREDLTSKAKPEDLKAGMTRDELIVVAGKPLFSIATSDEERLSYQLASGIRVDIVLREGKVAEVLNNPGRQ